MYSVAVVAGTFQSCCTWAPPGVHVVRSPLAISRPGVPRLLPRRLSSLALPSGRAPCPWIATKKPSCRPPFPNSHHRPRIRSHGYSGRRSAKTTHPWPWSVLRPSSFPWPGGRRRFLRALLLRGGSCIQAQGDTDLMLCCTVVNNPSCYESGWKFSFIPCLALWGLE